MFETLNTPPPSQDCEIACGDSLKILRDLPSGYCDMLLTDPPYCSGGLTRSERRASPSVKYQQTGTHWLLNDFQGDARDERSFVLWCSLWMAECWRILSPGSSAVVFSDWRQLANTCDAIQAGGFVFRGIIPWVKPSSRPQPNSFRADCEFAVWATKGDIDRRPTPEAKYLPGHYEYAAPREREHMNQKPVSLLRDLMAICPEHGSVLDPFMGSGTTGVACLETGRKFVGMEMEGHYYDVARIRLLNTIAGLG